MATVSRLILPHPALGTAGGAALHTSIEALYQKIGDAIANRWYQITDFDNGESVDCEHNFDLDISNLRYQIYVYAGGQWVLLTDSSSPLRSAFTVAETVGFEDLKFTITNVSGGNDLLVAFVVTNDPLYLENGDIEDVDITTTPPEDGQALVYDSASDTWKPGASGDSSFKIQSVTDPNAVIKGGYLLLDSGEELATWDGAGSLSTDYGKDLTVSLDTILGTNPANATAYYLYIDRNSLAASVTLTDNGRKVYAVVQANFHLSTTVPESKNPQRYIPLGVIRSADSGTVWSGTGSKFATLAARRHDTNAAFFAEAEKKSYQLTTAVASNITAHLLSGTPQLVQLYYYDGTKKNGLDPSAHLLDVTATNIEVATLGLTFGGGQYVEIIAYFFPNLSNNVVSLQQKFESSWFTTTATTSVAHNLNDLEDIRGYEVQEYDTTLGRIKNIDRSALVKYFTATTFELDWTGLTPSATLKYRVVAGGTPIPAALPIEYGGFNKFVGRGPGSYATLSAALAVAAPGDSILVMKSFSEAANVDISVANVRIRFMPNVTMTIVGTFQFRILAANVTVEKAQIKLEPTATLARGISIDAADSVIDVAKIELNTAQTLTDAVHITSNGSRTYVAASVKATLGTVTNLLTNNDGASFANVWGG